MAVSALFYLLLAVYLICIKYVNICASNLQGTFVWEWELYRSIEVASDGNHMYLRLYKILGYADKYLNCKQILHSMRI
jgi:hypothetical protein